MGIYSGSTASLNNPYKFSYYRNSAANSGNSAFAQVVFDTKIFDTGSNFASGTFTAPVAGFYQFNASVNMTTGTTNITSIFKNGAEYHRGDQIGSAGTTSVAAIIQLAANDTVDVRSFGNAANALGVGSTALTWFNGFLVSLT